MKFCSHCGKELLDDAVICIGCGCSVDGAANNPITKADEVDRGLCVLSAFVPLFGILYWIIKCKDYPKKSKACGITGIVSWAVCMFLYVFLYLALGY